MASSMAFKARVEEEPRDPNAFDLDAREDEIRPITNGDFDSIQLGEHPTRSVKVGVRLSLEVRVMLVEVL